MPFSSHLESINGSDCTNVRHARDVVADHAGGIDAPHGSVMHDGVIPTDARAKRLNTVGMSRQAQSWAGSSAHFSSVELPDPGGSLYANHELPPNDPFGHGAIGSTCIVSSNDLDAVDAQHGTHPEYKPLTPGAYSLSNGMVLLVDEHGLRSMIAMEDYQKLFSSHTPSLTHRIIQHVRDTQAE